MLEQLLTMTVSAVLAGRYVTMSTTYFAILFPIAHKFIAICCPLLL